MFNKDFYPTPPEVIDQLIDGLEMKDKVLLDPESGKADILILAKELGARVLGCEINDELYKISNSHAEMIGRDFLKLGKEDVSHIDYIVMNPPFSADIKHIIHAISIAPDGCKIRALCNDDTLQLDQFKPRKLRSLIEEMGSSVNIGNPFTTAERKTKVNVSLIKIDIPEKEQEDWNQYFEFSEEELEQQEEGLMTHDIITEIVGRYVQSLKMYKKVDNLSSDINNMMSSINNFSISFGCTMRDEERRGETIHLGYETFKTKLQKSAWKTIFNNLNMDKYMTETLKEKINKFVEQQSQELFSRRNIYNMLHFINSTNTNRMDEVLIEVFDLMTKHHHENRFHVEGWKTNSHYMINKKMIIPYMMQKSFSGGMGIDYRNAKKIDDLTKALCYITGINYDNIQGLEHWLTRTKIEDPEHYRTNDSVRNRAKSRYKHYSTHWEYQEKFNKKWKDESQFVEHYIELEVERMGDNHVREFGKWYEWGFFEVKGFKKGTMHLKFKDDEIWKMFNKKVADIKGFVLPEALKPKKNKPQPEHKADDKGQLLLM